MAADPVVAELVPKEIELSGLGNFHKAEIIFAKLNEARYDTRR